MAFRRQLPRRALVAAALGALYGLLLLPAPSTLVGVSAVGVAWFALSLSLLFLRPLAYHTFTAWTILWVVWKGFENVRAFQGVLPVVLDIGMPAAAFALLLTSGYLQAARESLMT